MVMHLLVVAIHLLTQLTGRVFPGKPGPFLQTSPGEPKTCLWLIDWTQWNYHLVMTNRASHGIDGPNWNRWFTMVYLLKMVDISMAMLNNQMVYEAPWSYLQARNKCRGPHNGNIGARGIPATALKGSRSAAHGSKSASDAVLNPTLETQKAERVRWWLVKSTWMKPEQLKFLSTMCDIICDYIRYHLIKKDWKTSDIHQSSGIRNKHAWSASTLIIAHV